MDKKRFYGSLLFALLLVLMFSTEILAQPGLPTTPDQAPIDGGLSLLAIAGGVYGYRKLKSRNSE